MVAAHATSAPHTKTVRLPMPVAALARAATRDVRAGDVGAFLGVETRTSSSVIFATAKVPAGSPSPADDYLDRPLDFNELLIENAAATFAVRVAGDSNDWRWIFPDDIAIVDRSRAPSDNVVLALVDGGFTIKRYRRRQRDLAAGGKSGLCRYRNLRRYDVSRLGVVTKAIRML